ncbi:uncharacterized protein LTR77_005514 [Saxophila tyrrhenica]|uniref:Brl1/Brr6 domain-containing protein n=1 Tax=Saxophila tyrrhenica TaxID=1690608 RepID=A0AAV9P8U7_9PEZI|nr:hypothetical protein LTR77_005514 [Saxophila tyrrhenica]
MSRYTGETPMDFEWGNGTGAVDARSPFAQVSSNAQRFPASPPKKSERNPRKGIFGRSLIGIEGTNSAFESSPSKQRTMGTSPSKPLPPTPAFNSLFSTPRRPRPEIDDSSAGETPKSPERGNDSDGTPDIVNTRSAMTMFDNLSTPAIAGAERNSPTKERPQADRRDSMLGRLVSKARNKIYSPGRSDYPRAEHVGAIEKKRSTKRKRDVDRRVARRRRHSMSDSGEEADLPPKSPRKRSGGHKPPVEKEPHWISNLFTFIGAHPSVPHILSYYAQFLFNVFLLGCCGYLIYCFWSAVQGDVDKKSWEAIADEMAIMAKCAKDYKANQCAPDTRTPYLENTGICQEWEKCMNRDPKKVGRARVSAHTFAEIFNSFVEPISWKAMAFTTILVFGCFGISNMAFGFFRNKAQQHQPPNYGYGYGPPPPTPQRAFSGQDGAFYAGTPWHMPPPGVGFEPQPSGGGYGQIEGGGSPVRRLVYN